jgi:hypothetical protein
MAATSPTALSRRHYEAAGFLVALVERRIPRCFKAVDLYGFADLVAIRSDRPGVLAIQTTTTDHQADRLSKALALPTLPVWLMAGNGLVVHGWKKSKKSGRWELTERVVTLTEVAAFQQTQAASGAPAAGDAGLMQPEGSAGHL